MRSPTPASRRATILLIPLLASLWPMAAGAAGPFRDLAADPASGLDYLRVPSPRKAIFDALKQQPAFTLPDLLVTPMKVFGSPGVALLDFDLDGDLDIFVTNGPGAANSLFANQLADTGELRFVDVAAAAGVAAPEDDANGVCFGDLDNDGDPDILVLTLDDPGRLFENRGDGTFEDITETSGLESGDGVAPGCSMGDVDGDGLLDISIAYSYDDWDNLLPYFEDRFGHNRPTRLYLNQGGNTFVDATDESGIDRHAELDPETALLSWANALVDYDQDGDLDLFVADDQTIIRQANRGGQDVGLIRLFENDGTGHFEDVTFAAGTDRFGAWMGLAFGDLDCDGHLDLFSTNLGDYPRFLGNPAAVEGEWASRWLLSNGDKTFRDPGVGDLVTTPFGWGATIQDFDNDGDDDIAYHGGFELVNYVDATNPGTLLLNQDCSATFSLDGQAFADSPDHRRRTVHGLASGDLDGDGGLDLVSVASFDIPPEVAIFPFPFTLSPAFDGVARFLLNLVAGENPGEFVWTGAEFVPGTLSVEINEGAVGGWLQVDPEGTVGLTSRGVANRDGIGAVVRLLGERPRVRAILGGSSFASQDETIAHFGLGSAGSGTVEVLWPGGVRNRLYEVASGERVRFPEIPCSFDGEWENPGAYNRCVSESLAELRQAEVLSPAESARFFASAVRAFRASR